MPKAMNIKKVAGRAGLAMLLNLGLVLSARAQPPERLRLDLSIGLLGPTNSEVFLGGFFAPRVGSVPPVAMLTHFDLTATVNITERVAISFGMPAGVASKPDFAEDLIDGGTGDVHAAVACHCLPETKYTPGITMRLEGGAPTATLALLGTGFWRRTGGATISKSFHPRFSIFADGSYSDFLRERDIRAEPMRSYSAGIGIGITKAMVLNIEAGEIFAGAQKEKEKVVLPPIRDLRVGAGFTHFAEGRPRWSFIISAGNLRDEPVLLILVKWAIVSAGGGK